MIDPTVKQWFEHVNSTGNAHVDNLIKLRESCKPKDIYLYRYLIKKMEVIIGATNRALDKFPVDFKLDDEKFANMMQIGITDELKGVK